MSLMLHDHSTVTMTAKLINVYSHGKVSYGIYLCAHAKVLQLRLCHGFCLIGFSHKCSYGNSQRCCLALGLKRTSRCKSACLPLETSYKSRTILTLSAFRYDAAEKVPCLHAGHAAFRMFLGYNLQVVAGSSLHSSRAVQHAA